MEPCFPACSLQWVLPDPVLLSICVHWRELFPSWAHTPTGSLILEESTRCVDKHQVRTNEKKWESRVWDTATVAYQCPSTLSYKRHSVPGWGQTTKRHMISSRQATRSRLETMVLSLWTRERLAYITSGGWSIDRGSVDLLMLQGVLSLARGCNDRPAVAYMTGCPRISTLSSLPTCPRTFCS